MFHFDFHYRFEKYKKKTVLILSVRPLNLIVRDIKKNFITKNETGTLLE